MIRSMGDTGKPLLRAYSTQGVDPSARKGLFPKTSSQAGHFILQI